MNKALFIICLVSILFNIFREIYFNSILKRSKCINGINLGTTFETVMFIEDTDIRVILDTKTNNLYVADDNGMTLLVDEKGKPIKYKGIDQLAQMK